MKDKTNLKKIDDDRTIKKEIGERLKHIRTLCNATQIEFANAINLKQSGISLIEKGEVFLTINIILQLYHCFKVNPNYLLLGYQPIFISNESFVENEIEVSKKLLETIKELQDDAELFYENVKKSKKIYKNKK